jgi:hypothetical protein
VQNSLSATLVACWLYCMCLNVTIFVRALLKVCFALESNYARSCNHVIPKISVQSKLPYLIVDRFCDLSGEK